MRAQQLKKTSCVHPIPHLLLKTQKIQNQNKKIYEKNQKLKVGWSGWVGWFGGWSGGCVVGSSVVCCGLGRVLGWLLGVVLGGCVGCWAVG